MNDPAPNRLDMLRFLERVQDRDLARTRQWIAAEEQRQAEREQGQQRKPPEPDWMIEPGINPASPAVYVHVGGCHMAGKRRRAASREQARQALLDGVAACMHCRPDTELGLID
ncbi:DUF6233 domain-containing protein [Streptomyces sp. LRE541]|uniref:DUF6233 domain-containing protein n=1 Tax=Streptomyces sp. LRE541 TaxID=2931983 RepID=UPI00200EDCE5|nr:DUF6233 domain-containing protein [Streptomyces sp. LRE541]UPZ27593.1 DUF6233 domain-containing protein [Streptomyces sp. LRE541]